MNRNVTGYKTFFCFFSFSLEQADTPRKGNSCYLWASFRKIDMKRLDRLVLTSFVPPFFAALMIAMFVLLMQTLWLYIDDIAGKGLGFFLVIELLAYKCVALIPLALPIAILISSVMVMGNLAENYELSSFKSAGVPLLRVMRAVMVFGFFSVFFSYYCANYLMPMANLKFGSRMYDIQRQKPALRLDAGVFNYDFQGFAIHIGEKGRDGRHIKKVLIYDHSDDNTNEFSEIIAKEGDMYTTDNGQYFVMNLEDGHQYIETRPGSSGQDRYPFVRTGFKEWTKVFDLGEFQLNRTDEELFKSNRSMLTINQLFDAVDSLDVKIAERERAYSDIITNYFYYLQPDSLRKSWMDTTAASSYNPDAATLSTEVQKPVSLQLRGLQSPVAPDASPATDTLVAKTGKTLTAPDTVINPLDTLTQFESLLRTYPVYERNRLYNKAETTTRSIQNQAEAAVSFLNDLRESRVKHIYDLYTKYSMAVVCLIFVFIGAPMGAIVRKGGFGYPILISIIFFMLFVVLTIFCRKIAESFVLPAEAAAWIPCVVLFPIGLILTVKAMNDSKLFNPDRLDNLLRKLFRRKLDYGTASDHSPKTDA